MGSAERTTPRTRGSRRKALTNVGGAVTVTGPASEEHGWLAQALEVSNDDESVREDVHGFHSYPARLHPATAARLLGGLARPRSRVLDPFCGSGTVLVEARAAGMAGIGSDANPLAVALAAFKSANTNLAFRHELLSDAEAVAGRAEARRLAKAGASRRYGKEDTALFDPHVLLELDGLRAGLGEVRGAASRRGLLLVLSSLLTKVSRRAGDSSDRVAPKRLASGFTIRMFVAKTRELVRRLGHYELRVATGVRRAGLERPEPVEVHLGDARALEYLRDETIDVVVTSPPYAGTYDYFTHHASRLRWLELDGRFFESHEIGSRRMLEGLGGSAAERRWEAEFEATLRELARVLRPDGLAALVLADSVAAGRALFADRFVPELAPKAGLRLIAIASQVRPHFHRATSRAFDRRPKREHVILLGVAPDRSARIDPPGSDRSTGQPRGR